MGCRPSTYPPRAAIIRLLSNLDETMAHTCRHADAASDRGLVVDFKAAMLSLQSQLQRFVTPADVLAQSASRAAPSWRWPTSFPTTAASASMPSA